MNTPNYDLKALCTLAGSDVTPRTVHYYIQQGLLPHATTGGARASYDQRHLNRLRLIKRLQRQHLPLAEIRERLRGLTDDEIEVAVAEASSSSEPGQGPASNTALDYVRRALGVAMESSAPPPPPAPYARELAFDLAPRRECSDWEAKAIPAQAPSEPSAASWERSQWDRIALTQDFELQVRRPLSREGNRKLERLLEAARTILEEET
jgi:DNA-binding transcriptional MerR regulator